jgi:GH18 family chitinase
MAPVLDYVVFMTYDLHGQWDYGSKWSNPGCDNGNCLRSHINMTETINSLSMITKAGVPISKIVTGVTSYGRSFQMTTAGCTGVECTFVGPESGAAKGPCTDTAGYISYAEITDIIARGEGNPKTWFDEDSASNIMVYNDVEWVAYMDPGNKLDRSNRYNGLNLAGTTDWAVDLDSFVSDTSCPTTSPYCVENQFQNKGELNVNWRTIDCNNEWIVDAAQDQTDRWYRAGADAAWLDAVAYWKAAPGRGGLSFSQSISNFFHGPEGMQCQSTSDHNGCDGVFTCETFKDTGAAAYFVVGSLTAIEAVSCLPG